MTECPEGCHVCLDNRHCDLREAISCSIWQLYFYVGLFRPTGSQ
jgi:hypothetical protein